MREGMRSVRRGDYVFAAENRKTAKAFIALNAMQSNPALALGIGRLILAGVRYEKRLLYGVNRRNTN